MISDSQIAELERRAQAVCAGSPARLAAIRRVIGVFSSDRVWRGSRDGHCSLLKILA
jgi:hypothetical protein